MCALYLLVAFAPCTIIFSTGIFSTGGCSCLTGGNVWSKQLGPPRLISPCQGVRDQNIPCICGSFQTWLTYTVTVAVYSCTATIMVTCLFSKVRLARMQVQCEHVVIHKLAARVNAPMSVYDMSAAG